MAGRPIAGLNPQGGPPGAPDQSRASAGRGLTGAIAAELGMGRTQEQQERGCAAQEAGHGVCQGWGRGRATGGAGCRQGWWMEEEWGAGPDAGFYGPRETPGPTQSGRPAGRPHYRINLLRTGACISVLAACSNAQTSGSAAQRSQAPAVGPQLLLPCPSRACAARTADVGGLPIPQTTARPAGGGPRAGRACRAAGGRRGAHAWRRRARRRRRAAARNLADLCAMPDPGPW